MNMVDTPIRGEPLLDVKDMMLLEFAMYEDIKMKRCMKTSRCRPGQIDYFSIMSFSCVMFF